MQGKHSSLHLPNWLRLQKSSFTVINITLPHASLKKYLLQSIAIRETDRNRNIDGWKQRFTAAYCLFWICNRTTANCKILYLVNAEKLPGWGDIFSGAGEEVRLGSVICSVTWRVNAANFREISGTTLEVPAANGNTLCKPRSRGGGAVLASLWKLPGPSVVGCWVFYQRG